MSASAVPGARPPVPRHRGSRTHRWRSSRGPPGRRQRIAAGVRLLAACRSPRQRRRRGWAPSPPTGIPMAGRNHLDSLDGPTLRTHAHFVLGRRFLNRRRGNPRISPVLGNTTAPNSLIVRGVGASPGAAPGESRTAAGEPTVQPSSSANRWPSIAAASVCGGPSRRSCGQRRRR